MNLDRELDFARLIGIRSSSINKHLWTIKYVSNL